MVDATSRGAGATGTSRTVTGTHDAQVCSIRAWRREDAGSLVQHANDREIWHNLRDGFPHPYTEADAARFLERVCDQSPTSNFAIEVAGDAVGGIGYHRGKDVERVSAEIGYWLARTHWGRGIMTSALRAATRVAFANHPDLNRVFAVPYAWNPASARVLEKAGYRLEGRMRQSAFKDGTLVDQWLYAILRAELPSES